MIGVEALARWNHPTLGLVGPSEFVPIAEQTGLITPLTSYVLDAALQQVRDWRDHGAASCRVAVNLSARSFLDAQLAVEIPRLLEKCGVEANLLELEITESMLMLDPGRAQATLERLCRIGLTLSVDDFGTGYSSLANLKRLPVDVHQDRQVVRDGHGDRRVRRGDRALDDRPRPQPRPAGRRRGRREPPGVDPPDRARLRPRPGLLRLPPAAGAGPRPAAGRAQRGQAEQAAEAVLPRPRPRCASSARSVS